MPRKLTEIISTASNWIKNTSSTNEFGIWVKPTDSEACRFCLMGAIRNKTGYKDNPLSDSDYDENSPIYPMFKDSILKVAKAIKPDIDLDLPLKNHIATIIHFNDNPLTTYKQIQEVLRKVEHEDERPIE